jgi:hypothetical protein
MGTVTMLCAGRVSRIYVLLMSHFMKCIVCVAGQLKGSWLCVIRSHRTLKDALVIKHSHTPWRISPLSILYPRKKILWDNHACHDYYIEGWKRSPHPYLVMAFILLYIGYTTTSLSSSCDQCTRSGGTQLSCIHSPSVLKQINTLQITSRSSCCSHPTIA